MVWSTEATSIMRRMVASAETDILIFNGPIERPRDRRLIKNVMAKARAKNLFMILVTYGGDPDAAYRMARCIKNHYEKFTICVSGMCKSAGTLLLLGADEVAFSEHGEIGPLDIQLAKKDDLFESESGLTVMTALSALFQNAQEAFDHFLLQLTTRSGGRITVRTASEVAAKLTQALYAPIAEQIDPIHMGEVQRSMAIAKKYGERLVKVSKLCDPDDLDDLISGYPSHGFVIDKAEAKGIFKPGKVRDCTPDEQALLDDLDNLALIPAASPWVKFLSDDILEEDQENARAASAQTAILEQSGTSESTAQTNGSVAPPSN